jgi:hypothetical protein
MSKNRIFQIVDVSEYAPRAGVVVGVFYAENANSARTIASHHFNNPDMKPGTGFYRAVEVAQRDLDLIESKALKTVERQTKILNRPLK